MAGRPVAQPMTTSIAASASITVMAAGCLCHAGCGWRAIIEAIGIEATELFDRMRCGRGS